MLCSAVKAVAGVDLPGADGRAEVDQGKHRGAVRQEVEGERWEGVGSSRKFAMRL